MWNSKENCKTTMNNASGIANFFLFPISMNIPHSLYMHLLALALVHSLKQFEDTRETRMSHCLKMYKIQVNTSLRELYKKQNHNMELNSIECALTMHSRSNDRHIFHKSKQMNSDKDYR